MFLVVQMREYMCYIGVRTDPEEGTVDFCLVKSEDKDDVEGVCVDWNVNEINNKKKEFYLTITSSLGVTYILTSDLSFFGFFASNVRLVPLDGFDMGREHACYRWRQDGDYLIMALTKMYLRTYVPIWWAAKCPSCGLYVVSKASDATLFQMVESFSAHNLK